MSGELNWTFGRLEDLECLDSRHYWCVCGEMLDKIKKILLNKLNKVKNGYGKQIQL